MTWSIESGTYIFISLPEEYTICSSEIQPLTPAGCPTIPFNSDTHYPELASDLPSQKQVPHETAFLQMPAVDGIPKLPGTLSNIVTNLGIPTTYHLTIADLLEEHTKLIKVLNLQWQFYVKGYRLKKINK